MLVQAEVNVNVAEPLVGQLICPAPVKHTVSCSYGKFAGGKEDMC